MPIARQRNVIFTNNWTRKKSAEHGSMDDNRQLLSQVLLLNEHLFKYQATKIVKGLQSRNNYVATAMFSISGLATSLYKTSAIQFKMAVQVIFSLIWFDFNTIQSNWVQFKLFQSFISIYFQVDSINLKRFFWSILS